MVRNGMFTGSAGAMCAQGSTQWWTRGAALACLVSWARRCALLLLPARAPSCCCLRTVALLLRQERRDGGGDDQSD